MLLTTHTIYLIGVFILHFIGDFILQADKMALNRSTSNKWLSLHVSVYSLCFLCTGNLYFVFWNGVIHFITDYITSRISAYFYKKEMRHEFFVTIGADQTIHALTLIILAEIFLT